MRAIDGDELISAVKSNPLITDSIKTYLKASVNAQPTIETEPRWIPVSERLPEENEPHVSEPCIVCFDNGAMAFSEMHENFFGQWIWECERDDDYYEPIGKVVAWMPLPKPYKETEE